MIGSNSIVERCTGALFSTFGEETLAIDEQAGLCYSLNVSGSRIWELISGPTSVDTICARLRQEFAVDKATCRRDVLHLLERLHAAGLIKLQPEAPHEAVA